jgi:hypothetical protein
MRAVVLTGYGDVDQLELREVPEPEAGPGEVKVRVTGSSVNPIDYFIRTGRPRERMNAPVPMALGRDASESSIKYDLRKVRRLLEAGGWMVDRTFFDDERRFVVHLARGL